MTTKSIFLCLTLLFALSGATNCKSSQTSTSRKATYKSVYIDQFKLTYFRQLLKKSYNNSIAIQEVLRSDHSGITEPVLTENDYQLIDSLTTADNELLKIDSIQGNRRAEGAQGKRPLGFILDKLEGGWLDSLARKRLKLSGVSKSWTTTNIN